jgi:AcrR family transcriptional regulator
MPDVKALRPASYRQLQALETKRRIARAARKVFADVGYAAGSIEQVAGEAGVAVRTVYAAFGGKKAILAAICDEWLAESGTEDAAGRLMGEADPRRRLGLIAQLNRRQWEAGQDVLPMLEAAAASDVEVARMLDGWKAERAGHLAGAIGPLAAALRTGMTVRDAAANLRALSTPEVYAELVRGEGWSPDRYEEWLGDLLALVLLES